jgi:hypothetical protein
MNRTDPPTPTPVGTHRSRLDLALLDLLASRSTAALGTLQSDGAPFVSMVPYALHPVRPGLILHVSALAAHRRQLEADPRVSLLVCAAEDGHAPVQALGRVTLAGSAHSLEHGGDTWRDCRAAYLARFPEAEPITELPDFAFVLIEVREARQIAGFGAARSLDAAALASLWSDLPVIR